MNLETAKKERRNWTASPFKDQDLPAISHFFKKLYRGPGTYGTMDLFQWKIIDNYVNTGIINLVKDEDRIASTTSATPKSLYFMGERQPAAEIGDTYTDPNYQRQGIFSLLINQTTKDAMDSGIPFVYGTPNSQSLPGYEKKANYKIIPGINVRSLVFPLNLKPFIQKKSNWLVGKYIDLLFSTFVGIYFLTKRIITRSRVNQIEESKGIPEGWNDFWEKSRKVYDFIFSRDRNALVWRFFDNPNKYKFYILRQNDQIIGYLVYRIIYGEDVTKLIISDYLFLPGYESSLTVLLSKALQDALYANVTTINAWCPQSSLYFKVLKKFGFIARGDVPVICFQSAFASSLNTGCKVWHFTVSDSDNV